MRLETREPGADVNPYLSLAASLASGLYGIENKLSLDIEQTKGNEYANKSSKKFLSTLNEPTDEMKGSDIPTSYLEMHLRPFYKNTEGGNGKNLPRE